MSERNLYLTPEQYSLMHEKRAELARLVPTEDGCREDTSLFVAWAMAEYGLRPSEVVRIIVSDGSGLRVHVPLRADKRS